jgi:PucR-like helix-turn-helix protein/diguanylate cyclase with GGDEF domain
MAVAGPTSLAQARMHLAKRLRARRNAIEQALLTRVYGVSDTSGINDPQYVEGLRVAVSTALEYGLTVVKYGDERPLPVPPVLLIQARAAARLGISLDTVLRRYFAGYALLGDFLIEEAARDELLTEDSLKRVLRAQAALFDRLLATIGEEYAREADARVASAEARRAERVQRLLDGELVDTAALDYDFDGHHLGVVAAGPDALDAVRGLGDSLDCRSLVVPRGETAVWAWLGARRELDPGEVERAAAEKWGGVSVAIGEPGAGLPGWRLTHEQARAALAVAVRRPSALIRYRDVALLASMLQDDLLSTSLCELYLVPLESVRDGGAALRETLRAYISAERNVSSAAAALGVSRPTVANRLRSIEERIGRPLNAALPGIEAALSLDGLNPTSREAEKARHGFAANRP